MRHAELQACMRDRNGSIESTAGGWRGLNRCRTKNHFCLCPGMAPNVAATAPGGASAPAAIPAPQARRPPFTPTEQQLAALRVAFARSENLPRKNSPACDQPEIKRLAELKISWVHAQTWFKNRRRAVRQQGSGGATRPPTGAAAAVDTPRLAMTFLRSHLCWTWPARA